MWERNFDVFIAERKRRYPDTFDDADLYPQFREYFRSGVRVKVRGPYGTRTGTIGVTTGWKPAFLLMSRSSAIGSSDVLRADDKIIAVKHGRRYVSIEGVE